MVQEQRIRKLNTKILGAGPVIYWMNRDIRSEDNWALLYAQEIALREKKPLMVVYNLLPSFLGGTQRHLAIKVTALKELEEDLTKKNIPFSIVFDEKGTASTDLLMNFFERHKAGVVVTDFCPLRISRTWVDAIRKKLNCTLYGVDAHNVVPTWIASDKKEFAAHTFRPKVYALLPEFLESFPRLRTHPHAYTKKMPPISWEKYYAGDSSQDIPEWFIPGEKAASKALKRFMQDRLETYALRRNDPNENGQSDLSPYLHYGILSAGRVALEVCDEVDRSIDEIISRNKNKAKVDTNKRLTKVDHAAAFLEELLVRRELSDNFCFYERKYDDPKGFPEWAQETLAEHAKDHREYLYTKKQFEHAQTHDELWNAAQRQMVRTGKMHGYMRMYWAKKILEWTPDAKTALKITIYLNDTYELDGRDPNGYVGAAWSIGGVHDRPWFERPIFGKIRYMNRSGCEKKFDVDAYIERWSA